MINWQPGMTLKDVEKSAILASLKFFRGNKTQAANALGVSVKTIHNKLKEYKIAGNDPESNVVDLNAGNSTIEEINKDAEAKRKRLMGNPSELAGHAQ